MTLPMRDSLNLVVRRVIRASPDRLFHAWTTPSQLVDWWGPREVTCDLAEVDLRVGGRYRIRNRFSDGRALWIEGKFEVIEPPKTLVYTWRVGTEGSREERVTVRFHRLEDGTEVTVLHERIPDDATRSGHELGWKDCLSGLERYLLGT